MQVQIKNNRGLTSDLDKEEKYKALNIYNCNDI